MAVSGVTSEHVETSLGRPLTIAEINQASMWIDDAELVIGHKLGDVTLLDAAILAYVVRESVTGRIRKGATSDGAESITVSVDDGSFTRRYGRLDDSWLLDDWRDLLALGRDSGAFSVRPSFEADDTGDTVWTDSTTGA